MKQDRFLQSILVGITLIAIVAVSLFFLRKGQVSYSSEKTPGAVIQNYTLALLNKEYDRAYSYLADEKDKPDANKFRQAFLSKQSDPASASLRIGDVREDGDHAYVTITLVHASQGLFEDVYRDVQNAELVRQSGEWKIRSMPYPYWNYDWYQPAVITKPAQPLP
jgi:hypothetical protein